MARILDKTTPTVLSTSKLLVDGVAGTKGMTWPELTAALKLGTNLSGFTPVLFQDVALKGVANGYASLDSGGLVPVAQLPDRDASEISYTAPGTGAVARTAEGKLSEMVSILDYATTVGDVADTTHTPTLSGADPTSGSHSPPSGTDWTPALIRAFAASKVVRIPKSSDGSWYTIKAGIGTAAGHDGVHIPDGGVLILEGDVLIDSRHDEMSWAEYPYVGPGANSSTTSSFGMTYMGDFTLTGGGRIDGGSQYTPVGPTSSEEFTYMRTLGPETISAISSLRCHDIRFLNACGSHITGGSGSTNHSATITLCHFGDYRDHALYFADIGDSVFDGNVFKAAKTTTTRDAVKGAGSLDGLAVTNNMFDVPNAIACLLEGNAVGSKSSGYKFSGNRVKALVGLQLFGNSGTSGIEDIAIEGNTFKTSSYCIIGGSTTLAANVKQLIIRGNTFIPTSTGIPVYLQSGSTGAGSGGATSNDSLYLDFEISKFICEDNVWFGTTTQAQMWLYGTFPYAEIRNNRFLGTGSAFPIRLGGNDQMEIDASYMIVEGNTFTIQYAFAAVEFAGTAVWASTDDVPWSIYFGRNQFLGSATRYLTQTGAAPSALITGTITYGDQAQTMAGANTGSTLSSATIVDNRILSGSATWDAASIADGDEEAKEITVTGAVLGDYVIGVSLSIDVEDLVLSAQVTATNTVTAILANNTGGAIDLASATVRAIVRKR